MEENKLDYLRNLDNRSLEGLQSSNEAMAKILDADRRLYERSAQKQEYYREVTSQVLEQKIAIQAEIDRRPDFGMSR